MEGTLEALWPDRLGHGVRSAEDPRVLEMVAESGVALEVCPGSNVALGVYATAAEVPLRAIVDAGIPVALGADDPLLFGSRLVAQYESAREALGFSDEELARLALGSVEASRAPDSLKKTTRDDITDWLAAPQG